MPHPIYGKPSHTLEVVQFSLRLPDRRSGFTTLLEAHGRSSTSRSDLWSFKETWAKDEQRGGLEPCDVLHWLALAAAQDRPASQEALNRSTMPGGWEDVTLPF